MDSQIKKTLSNRLLMMADDELILAHRNSEWTGHAPILEEDIAFANIAQDELGHAVVWYRLITELSGGDPDELVFFRTALDYRSCQLVELPKGDWAHTMVRQYLFDAFELVRATFLLDSSYRPIMEAAAKIRQEELYHYRHTSSWIKRLGWGTDESNRRTQNALDNLWPYSEQLFSSTVEDELLEVQGIVPQALNVKSRWQEIVLPFLEESGFQPPASPPFIASDRSEHSDHLAPLLAEMQEVARLDRQASW